MTVTAARRQGGIREYLAIARFDHATKHVFVIPGMVLAYILRGVHSDNVMRSILLGFVCVVMIASANYVINEWLDRDFDKHHPTKSQRSAVDRTQRTDRLRPLADISRDRARRRVLCQ